MEKNMKTTMRYLGLYRDNEKKMATTIGIGLLLRNAH